MLKKQLECLEEDFRELLVVDASIRTVKNIGPKTSRQEIDSMLEALELRQTRILQNMLYVLTTALDH